MTLKEALARAAEAGLARIDAQLLLLHVLGRPGQDRGWLLAHDDEALAAPAQQAYAELCRRRLDAEPLAYLTGDKEFFGLALKVDPRVLVPRPDTETLVEWALELLGPLREPRVIDLGTGSGAIALAIRSARPDASVEAVDRSAGALAVAQANAQRLGLAVHFRRASWLDGAGRYDLVVSNPPYVRPDDEHLCALRHEPRSALVSGDDGLADLRAIVSAAPRHLEPGGWLLLEHGWDQAAAVEALLAGSGFSGLSSRKDLGGITRCSGGRRPELG